MSGCLLNNLAQNDAVLVADRADAEERDRNRELLRQQDLDYERSLRSDRENSARRTQAAAAAAAAATAAAAAAAAVTAVAAPPAAVRLFLRVV